MVSGKLRRTRYDLNIVSTETNPAHEISAQDENKLTQDCEGLCLFLTDGLITSITWDQRTMTGPSLIARGLGFREVTTDVLIPWWQQ